LVKNNHVASSGARWVVAGGLLVLYQVTLKAQPPKAARHFDARRFGVLTASTKHQATSNKRHNFAAQT